MKSFPFRAPEHIMDQVRAAAKEDNVSTNHMMLALVSESLGHRRGILMLRERAQRGNVDAALAVLNLVPDTEPDPGDEMPEPSSGGGQSPGP